VILHRLAQQRRLFALALPLALAGCTQMLYGIAIPILYSEAELPEAQVVRDVAYRDDPSRIGRAP